MLSVDHHLERFPNVKENVERLHAEGTIHYVETIDLISTVDGAEIARRPLESDDAQGDRRGAWQLHLGTEKGY